MQRGVIVTTSFVGFHRYDEPPPGADFLRAWHRHVFFVKVTAAEATSRGIEFIRLKKKVDRFLDQYRDRQFEASCEDIAEATLLAFPEAIRVEVFEDNENGGYIER